ncbi:hypothetical protein QBC33DRAFT_557449 [Phialemonium atrogriseum]|uniref:Uncharacterized protein n=1 Tax=Phialemonium atrogriseum TaxID=1093897 RepID=A0AAJ0C2E4_9PEZI|nr:uncharacterized protein QBC33DRAFT_557449 [Phialemonium atrogriseum]KAK1768670.1 hypothetical protein QBC33DRAFT_557449 [Phialemonium atrogriseum]
MNPSDRRGRGHPRDGRQNYAKPPTTRMRRGEKEPSQPLRASGDGSVSFDCYPTELMNQQIAGTTTAHEGGDIVPSADNPAVTQGLGGNLGGQGEMGSFEYFDQPQMPSTPVGAPEHPEAYSDASVGVPIQGCLTHENLAQMGYVGDGGEVDGGMSSSLPSSTTTMHVGYGSDPRWSEEILLQPVRSAESKRAARRSRKTSTIAFARKAHQEHRPKFSEVDAGGSKRVDDLLLRDSGRTNHCGRAMGWHDDPIGPTHYPSELLESPEDLIYEEAWGPDGEGWDQHPQYIP